MRHQQGTREATTHNEEMPGRMASDAKDKGNMQLEMCIDPLNSDNHPDGIVNIVTGRIAPDAVNVDNYVAIWERNRWSSLRQVGQKLSMSLCQTKWLPCLSPRNVKPIKLGSADCFDTNLIYSRVMGLMSSREVDLTDVFSHELAPVPPSMFEDSGDMRITKSKSTLKRKLQVEQSSRTLPTHETSLLTAVRFYGKFNGQNMVQSKTMWTMYWSIYSESYSTVMWTSYVTATTSTA